MTADDFSDAAGAFFEVVTRRFSAYATELEAELAAGVDSERRVFIDSTLPHVRLMIAVASEENEAVLDAYETLYGVDYDEP